MPVRTAFSDAEAKLLQEGLRLLVREHGSEARVGELIGVRQQTVDKYIHGKTNPGVVVAERIAKLIGRNSLSDLIGRPSLTQPGSLAEVSNQVMSLTSRGLYPNLRVCVAYHRAKPRWSPWTIAAAEAGLFGELDLPDPSLWARRLDSLETGLKKLSQLIRVEERISPGPQSPG